MSNAAASGSNPNPNPRKRKAHRACDYCREHRIRCEYDGQDACKHCFDYDIPCNKIAPPPRDNRPRKRFVYQSGESENLQGLEPGYLGGSSLTQLFWSFCPASAKSKLHQLDNQWDIYRGAVCDNDEQGLLVGREIVQAKKIRGSTLSFDTASAKLAEGVGADMVLDNLYDTASTRIITVFPVISKHESLLTDAPDDKFWDRFVELHHNSTPPTPLPRVVRIIHCALAAMSREVPSDIRDNLLNTLQNLSIGGELERLSRTSTISSVQVLVLLTMCDEINGAGGTTAWLKLGTAIRMAMELALHRNISLDLVPLAQRNRRSRVWGACICADRWMALRLGQAMTIDLDMCDVPMPQELPDHVGTAPQGRWSPSFRFLSEYTKMSVLLGRTYRLTCSPSGLLRADDQSLLLLQAEIDLWVSGLPLTWPYSPNLLTPEATDLMNIFCVSLEFTFLRPFLWPSSPPPVHLIYRPPAQRWTMLIQRAQQATKWAEQPSGAFYLDIWSNVLYSMVCCMLVHVKAYEQTRTEESKMYVDRTEQIIKAWAAQLPNSPQRGKIAGMTSLLRDSTLPSSSSVGTFDILTPGGSLSDTWLTAMGTNFDFGVV